MIDFEKLKEAHELALKLDDCHFEVVCGKFDHIYYSLWINGKEKLYVRVNTIDSIIDKLKELNKSKPKYEVGQKVFVIPYTQDIPEIKEATIKNTPQDDEEFYYIEDRNGYCSYGHETKKAALHQKKN